VNVSKSLHIDGHKFEINSEGHSYHYTPKSPENIINDYGSKHIMVPTEKMLVKAILKLLEKE
jgi:hypothetical protein